MLFLTTILLIGSVYLYMDEVLAVSIETLSLNGMLRHVIMLLPLSILRYKYIEIERIVSY